MKIIKKKVLLIILIPSSLNINNCFYFYIEKAVSYSR